MTRKHLTGLLLAAATMTVGTLTIVQAQDAAEEAHDHEHTPTTVHAGDDTAFELDDEAAYPDPDGFASMFDRISYAIGRNDGKQIPASQPDLDPEVYGEGIRKGLSEENKDYALGYAQGFEMARRFLAQQTDDIDMEAFVAGVAAALKEDNETRSIGYLIGNSYREADFSILADSYLAGVEDSLAAAEAQAASDAAADADAGDAAEVELKLSDEQINETLDAFSEYLTAKQRDEAIAEGRAFLDGLTEEDGWQKTESGIVYKVIEAGEGESPDANDVVTAHYEGSLSDGSVFQTSFGGPPFTRAANQLIPGWTEMLQQMKPGATYEIVLPYELAYGEQGSPPDIPPYATLKFKIQLLSFEAVPNADEAEPAPPAE